MCAIFDVQSEAELYVISNKMGVYCKSDRTQKLPPCIHSEISQSANEVYSRVTEMCGLACISPVQVALHSSHLSSVKLF